MRQSLRFLFAVVAVVVGGLLIRLAVGWDRCRGRDPLSGAGRIAQRWWCRCFCAAFGVRVRPSERELAGPPVLIAANHISWLDIVVLASLWPVAFLSKSEVARWPVIGGVATGLGTLYIRRGGPSAAREATELMASRLRDGGHIVFFPEGTTGDGSSLRPFRPRLFQAAIDADAPVQPVGLAYRHPDGSPCARVPFGDSESLAATVWSLAAVPRLTAQVLAAPAIAPAGRGRSELSRLAREAMANELAIPASEGKGEAGGKTRRAD